MTNEKNQKTQQVVPQQFIYPGYYQQEEDIDLVDVFSGLFAQWRWLLGLTLCGTILAVIIALALPKEYEIDARVALPSTSNIQAINVRGYEKFTVQTLFNEYYDQLRSANQFRNFLRDRDLLKKFHPDSDEGISDDELFSRVYENFGIEVLEPVKKKGEENGLPPTLVKIKLLTKDESLGVTAVNEYIGYINQYILKDLV
ncbi:MAG: Wzz/FepE/Etk N-terminal domain-containing protein, partial [Gammaproteobacteria bacterium]